MPDPGSPLLDPSTADLGLDGAVIPFEIALRLAEAEHRTALHRARLMDHIRWRTAELASRSERPAPAPMPVATSGIQI